MKQSEIKTKQKKPKKKKKPHKPIKGNHFLFQHRISSQLKEGYDYCVVNTKCCILDHFILDSSFKKVIMTIL